MTEDEAFNDKDLDFDENADQFPEEYDHEDIFDNKIHPLLKTIINICNEYEIPMLTCFQYRQQDGHNAFCTSTVIPQARISPKLLKASKTILE